HRLRVVLPLYSVPHHFSTFHTALLFSAAPLLHAFLLLFYDLTVVNLAVAVGDDFTLSLFGLSNSPFGSYLYFLFIAFSVLWLPDADSLLTRFFPILSMSCCRCSALFRAALCRLCDPSSCWIWRRSTAECAAQNRCPNSCRSL